MQNITSKIDYFRLLKSKINDYKGNKIKIVKNKIFFYDQLNGLLSESFTLFWEGENIKNEFLQWLKK